MIYCQRDIPKEKWRYGFRSSARVGCGWIAVYNALQLMGRRAEPEELIRFFERRLPLINGNFGTTPLSPAAYFRKIGLPVVCAFRRKEFDRLAKGSDAALVYYCWRSGFSFGAHFIAVQYDGENFIGYNVYSNSKGPDRLGPSLEGFLREGKRFFAVVIGVKKQKS